MDVINKVDSKLLGRIEVSAKIKHAEKATPSMNEVKEMVCKKENCKPDLVVVKEIKGSYGSGESEVLVYIYKSKEDLDRLERQPKKETVKKEEKPVEEKPKEEKKEDGKEEGKEEQSPEQKV